MIENPALGNRFVPILRFAITAIVLFPSLAMIAQAEEVSFSRDVLPVLSDRCFHCHGPDDGNREADLRLDLESAAKEDLGGYAAVTPDSLEDSELWRRIVSDDEDERMPPADSHRKPLSEPERTAIRQWILDGAKWGKHWSFEKLTRPAVPSAGDHPIDAFVIDRLNREGLALSQPAPPTTLLRRLSLDLTGLAPSLEEVQRASEEWADDQWETQIDRLLQSPHYAERMAMWWLDAARYSDSDGYQQDATRQNWPWRDWVIQQFRDNKPFDEFTTEQFAGDLLPDSTTEQKLATCFHRNHMTNGEGGRDPEQSRIDYVIDRVNTMGTVWLGLTLGCVQCHSHKFDPITQHDYYSLFAFFNSIDEDGRAGNNAKPYLKYESPLVAERVKEFDGYVKICREREAEQRKQAEERFDTWLKNFAADPPHEYEVWQTLPPRVSSSDGTLFRVEAEQIIQSHGPQPRQDDYRITLMPPKEMPLVTGFRLEVFPHEDHQDGRFTRYGNGEFTLSSVRVLVRRAGSPAETQVELSRATADVERNTKFKSSWDKLYGKIKDTLNDNPRNGWTTIGVEEVEKHTAVFEFRDPCLVNPDDQLIIVLRQRTTHGNANIGRFRIALATERGETVRRVDGGSPIIELVNALSKEKDPNSIDPKLRKRLLDQFLLGDGAFQKASQLVASVTRQRNEVNGQKKPRNVMVLAEREEPRKTHVLVRGVWDAKGDEVQRGVVPSVLKWPADKTKSRLDLARWLVDPENPLTARVVVNHLWQLMFGQGLVRTPEDFGLQGQLPTHPRLLDWLAVELIENEWNLQHVLRLIATSQTYMQSSDQTADLLERDPKNRLLARAPRFRMSAWMIRDNALRASGLLNTAIGGPPIRPYQPEGVWADITMGRFTYRHSVGPAQYRRTVYGFWRRSAAPTFLFDSSQRRVCEVGIRRTNTPLHALTLMNDTTMLEASRALADRVMANSVDLKESEAADWRNDATTNAIQLLAQRVLSRMLDDGELKQVHAFWFGSLQFYNEHVEDAIRYTTIGQRDEPNRKNVSNTAAWMATSSLLLNLDEAMTRE